MCDVIGTFLHYSYEPVSKVRASEMVHLEGSGKVGTLDADNYTSDWNNPSLDVSCHCLQRNHLW